MRRNIILLGIFLISPNLVAKSNQVDLTNKEFVEAPDRTPFNSNYKNTSCAYLYKGRQRAGLHCKSNDPELLGDLGVFITKEENNDSPGTAESSIKSIDVSSGLSSYPAKKKDIGKRKFYVAEIDCDEGNSDNLNTYRATSTCFVGINLEKNGNFEYYIMTLTNDISGAKISTTEGAINFITSKIGK